MRTATAAAATPTAETPPQLNRAAHPDPDSTVLADREAVVAFARQRLAEGQTVEAVHAELKDKVDAREVRIGDKPTLDQLRKLAGEGSPPLPPVVADVDTSISFLHQFHPASPWALATFGAGNEVGPAATFDPSEEAAARRFITAHAGRWNIYFSVNVVGGKLTKKAKKTDIKEVHWLHVDADLNKRIDWSDPAAIEADKTRVLEKLRSHKPPPTAITWSGGGCWGFWRLSEAHVVNGDDALMRPFERRMERIEEDHDADACHNADRIARLPGTPNILGRTKMAVGRKPALAEVIEFHDDRIYDVQDFPEPESRLNGSSHSKGHRQPDYDLGEYERARDALNAISADNYDIYREIGMALNDAFGDAGFDLYREWAQRSIKFDEGEIRKKWRSFSPGGGITIASLFGTARANGWKPKRASKKKAPGSAEKTAEGDGKEADPTGKPSVGGSGTKAELLITAVLETGIDLYHAPDSTAYADIAIKDHVETWAVRSRSFKRYLRRIYYEKVGGAPGGETLEATIGTLESRAEFDGIERPVYLRTAEHDGRLYIDMCDAKWRVIEVSTTGWLVIDSKDAPVRFRRTPGMQAMPEPASGDTKTLLSRLRKHLHMSDDAYVLCLSWVLAALRPGRPYPILALAGEAGTGKSTTTRILRYFVDPNVNPLSSLPKEERDAFIGANNRLVQAFDNLSGIAPAMADTLCKMSTGGGLSTRKLFTDDEESIFDGLRPVILNSINDIATRSDLADRALLAHLDVIPEDERKTEEELWNAFKKDASGIFGAILDVVAHGLKMLPQTKLEKKPRMADFAVWIAACETKIWEAGTHKKVYGANRASAHEIVLENDPVAGAIREFMQGATEHTTTLVDLLTTLGLRVTDAVKRHPSWPATSAGLKGRLTRLKPPLRSVGIIVQDMSKERHTKRARIRLTAGGNKPPQPPQPSHGNEINDLDGEVCGEVLGVGEVLE